MPPFTRDLLAYFGVLVGIFLVPVMAPTLPTLYFAKTVPPWALATAASCAGCLTATADYHLVRRVFRLRALERVRGHRYFERFERWAKVAPFWTTLCFAAFPLPFILPRVLMPLSGYSIRRYVAAVTIGRYPRIFVIASFGEALEVPNEVLLVMLAGGALMGSIGLLVRHLRARSAARRADAQR